MQTIKLIQVNRPVKLSTGALIMHRPEPNGSQFAYISGSDKAMTSEEYAEYVQIRIKKLAITN